MTKRPKTPAIKSTSSDVQRATVRRSQTAGKNRARAQAERTAGQSSSSPPVSTQSIATPAARLRRQFVWLLILVAVGLIGLAIARNGGNWLNAMRNGTAPIGIALPTGAVGPPRANVANALPTEPAVAPAIAPAVAPAIAPVAATIGIISGHRGNDSGATCDDGLTEASINFATATRVATLLRAEGYTAIILDEFDARLKGYEADALLSIHSDSCKFINDQATGYKVARFLYSDIPQVEDKLVACISARYQKATGLRFHTNTVTHNMLEYHALRKIDSKTPGAIIELGFMNLDRNTLTHRQDAMARGIVGGLMCFLHGEKP